MEIHILLEGEQVGPLTEEQVRQYLNEGLVNGDDLASYEGMADWLPLESLLAKLAPASATIGTALTGEPAIPSQESVESAADRPDAPFVMLKDPAESADSPVRELRQKTQSLTSTQRTRRKLNKIVIQPILPLETTLPTKRKAATGKTLVKLDALRPMTALPTGAGHPPREKKAARSTAESGQLSFAGFAEKPVEASASAVEAPVVVSPEPVSPAAPASLPEPVAPAPKAEAVLEPAPSAPALAVLPPALPEPVPATALPASTSLMLPTIPAARFVPPAGPANVEVLRPPVERLSHHFKKPEGPRSNSALFPRVPAWALLGGLAVALLIVCGLIVCLYLWLAHKPTAAASDSASSINVPPVLAEQPAPVQPTTASEFSDRGLKRQASGDLDGALADYDQALGLDPKAVEVFYRRGLAHQAKGDLAGAMADYTQVIALNPQRANAFSNRAFIRQSQGDLDGALADYFHALLIDPNISEAYNNIGLINVKRGDIDGAIAAYDSAIKINPQMAFAFYNRGSAKSMEGNTDGAIADYTQALLLNPNIARAYCDRGIARQAKGDSDGALADFSKALALNPKMGDAFYNRGVVELLKGDFDAAMADEAQALALDPKNAPAYDHRGLALLGMGKRDDALADLSQFCALAPRDPSADAARLYIWLISTRQNPGADADAQLSRAVLNDWNSPPEDLTSKIAAFLLGHISETELIANAASPDPKLEPGQYCRVFYFAGMKRLLGGDTTTAATDFQRSVATGQKDFCEYAFAQAELQELQKNPEVAAKPAPGT